MIWMMIMSNGGKRCHRPLGIMPNYKTALDPTTGLTNVICRTCGAMANCGKFVAHKPGCAFFPDNKRRNLKVRSETRVIHTQVINEQDVIDNG